jgi:hypothetical protein
MWTCPKCGRIFKKAKQPHSCKKVPLEKHFENKEKAKRIFNYLVEQITSKIGECKIISIPCCVHLFGKYDFLAALPKKDRLEIRFALDRKLDSPRLKQCVQMSTKVFKNCFEVNSEKEINNEFVGWLKESYHLRN